MRRTGRAALLSFEILPAQFQRQCEEDQPRIVHRTGRLAPQGGRSGALFAAGEYLGRVFA